MNMLVSATAIAAATPVAASAKAHDVLVTELYPPTGPNSSVWSAITLDGQGQRWAISADPDGQIRLAFREDRKDRPRSNGQFCWYQEPAPDAVRDAIGRAIAERGGATNETTDDPVYAAIERHRQAFLVYDEAITEHSRCEAKIQERGSLQHASVTVPLIKIVEGQPCVQLAEEGGNYSSVPLTDELLLNPPGNIVVRQCYRNKGIDEALPGPELEAARKTARRQLASAARRRRRVWEVAGLPAASGNVAATSAEAQHAQVELALVIPETAAGAMAVITYWCDHANVHLQGALYNESEFMMRLLTSLHATFGSLRKLRSM